MSVVHVARMWSDCTATFSRAKEAIIASKATFAKAGSREQRSPIAAIDVSWSIVLYVVPVQAVVDARIGV